MFSKNIVKSFLDNFCILYTKTFGIVYIMFVYLLIMFI